MDLKLSQIKVYEILELTQLESRQYQMVTRTFTGLELCLSFGRPLH